MIPARAGGTAVRRRLVPSLRSGRLAAAALALAVALAACGSSTVEPSSGAPGQPTVPAASSDAPGDSSAPAASPTPGGETTTPTAFPTASGLDGSAGPGATACSGSAENRSFFAAAATNLPWDVYCAVLPDGWFVEAGNYRLGGGGTLRIAYDGPNGSRLELREGAICGSESDCRPSGQTVGQAAFGDRQGDLIALDGGGYEIVVEPDAPVSWLAVGANLDEAAFRDIASALLLVAR